MLKAKNVKSNAAQRRGNSLVRHLATVFTASALIMSLLTSCAYSDRAVKSSDDYQMDYAVNEAADSFEEMKGLSEESRVLDGSKSGDKKEAGYEDKIIRTANIVIEAADAQKCYDTLSAFAKKNGGKEISVSKSTNTYGNYDYINIEAELKIEPEKLNDFIALAEKTDKVTSSEVSTNDITQEYYDIKIRLETKKEALKNYYKLLKEASTIEESLEVQRYIADITAEIESMEGMLKYYDSKVDLSSIHLSISQQVRLHVGAEDDFEWDSLSFGDFLTLIKNGFLSVVNFLWSLLLWLIIIIIAVSPVLLIAVLVIFLIRRYRKKHPKKPKAPRKVNAGPNYMSAYYPQMPAPIPPAAQPVVSEKSEKTEKSDSPEKKDK